MKKLLSILLLMVCSMSLWANVAPPSQGGQSLTEPNGVGNIDIIKEDLTIDFTQLGDETVSFKERFVSVEAIYEIDNPSDIENLELIFVIVSDAKNFQFFLDDKEITYELIDNTQFADRKTWKKPEKTPFENRELMYSPQNYNLKSAKFTLKLLKGKHLLKAKYKAEPTVYKDVGIMKGWQFAYSLAPARDWKSFSELNLNINVPTNWKFFSNLNLQRNGDTLTANFKEIPADSLAITTQSPIPESYNIATNTTFFIFLACLIVVPILLIIFAFTKGFKWKNSWAYGILAGIIWAVLVGISGFSNLVLPSNFIPESQYASYGYEELYNALSIIILIPIAFIVGIILWVISILIAKKRKS